MPTDPYLSSDDRFAVLTQNATRYHGPPDEPDIDECIGHGCDGQVECDKTGLGHAKRVTRASRGDHFEESIRVGERRVSGPAAGDDRDACAPNRRGPICGDHPATQRCRELARGPRARYWLLGERGHGLGKKCERKSESDHRASR